MKFSILPSLKVSEHPSIVSGRIMYTKFWKTSVEFPTEHKPSCMSLTQIFNKPELGLKHTDSHYDIMLKTKAIYGLRQKSYTLVIFVEEFN